MAYKYPFKSCSLRCPQCKNIQRINRKLSKLKKPGHKKHLWCPICKKTTRHIEIGKYEM